MKRMWINQPSTLQPHHALHGTNVLMVEPPDDEERTDIREVYFLSGPVHSQKMSILALSEGWVTARTPPSGLNQEEPTMTTLDKTLRE